jgi:release factor glutamine methyltransferase
MPPPTLLAHTTALAQALGGAYPEAEAQAIAALVLETLLGLSPLQRRLQANAPVPPAVAERLPGLAARLLAHEPVQYVLGEAHFADMVLEVTPATLIPRPETEELVQLAARANATRPGLTVLDVGTGSGCLALGLARALPSPARVLAVDISAAALAVARRNAARYAPLIEFQELDILRELPAGLALGSLDVLASNPPYVRASEQPLMRENVLAWEPATALFVPDDDPLLFYRRLGEVGRHLLRPGGALYFEINEAFSAETQALLRGQGYAAVQGVADMFDRPRMVRATAP